MTTNMVLKECYDILNETRNKKEVISAVNRLIEELNGRTSFIDALRELNKQLSIKNQKIDHLRVFDIARKNIQDKLTNELHNIKEYMELMLYNGYEPFELSAIVNGWIPPINWAKGTDSNQSLSEKINRNKDVYLNSMKKQICKEFYNKLKEKGMINSESEFDKII